MIDANSQFFAILTNVGVAKQANADALGIPWKITDMGVGDANGTDPIPNAAQTALIHEWRRRPLNQIKIDPNNPAVIIAEQIIPADEGGKWIREIGLYDADGDLVAVANCAPSFKPVLTQGSGRTQIVRMNFIVTSAGNITLKIDPAIVLASRAYVDAAILEVLPANKTPGVYRRVTVNNRGVVVSGDNPETLAGFGIKDTYTKPEIESMIAQASALPVGAMVAFPKAVVAPGFLEVDGSVQSIATYPDLFAYLGTTFNTGGEGAGNFRLPESRAEFLRGWDHGRGVDAGRALGSWQADDNKAHTHNNNSVGGPVGSRQDTLSAGSGIFIGSSTSKETGSSGGSEARPRNLAVMWCIKAWNAPINQGNIDIAALAAQVAVATPQGHLSGFCLVMNGAAPATTVDVGPGAARSLGNPVFSSVTISGVLQAAGAWSAGTGGNKLDTGVRAVSAWYHVFALRRIAGGEADVLFSLSPTGPQVPAGYELICHIGSLGTDAGGGIRPFLMEVSRGRRRFRWVTPILDVNEASLSTAAISYKLSVPTGIAVDAEMNTFAWANNAMVYFSALDTADLAPANSTGYPGFTCGYGSIADSATDSSGAQLSIKTNANAQIRARANVAVKVSVLTLGWEE
ncbi:phage tail protein [Pseudomonas sp. NPDC087614]|uniref:phage tail-collar fiber domain-containing protein n=1 Tax=Pseudomonas sp. NPDC087614 TaxID=3364442 RepID=UPI0038015A7C